VRLRTLGQPGLGAMLAARLPGVLGDNQGRHASATDRTTPRLDEPRSPRPPPPRAEQAHLLCHRTRDLPSIRPRGIGDNERAATQHSITPSATEPLVTAVRVPVVRFEGARDQGRPPRKGPKRRRGLVVRFPGCGMTGCGSARGYLFEFVNSAIVLAFAGQPGGHVLCGGTVAGSSMTGPMVVRSARALAFFRSRMPAPAYITRPALSGWSRPRAPGPAARRRSAPSSRCRDRRG
jgi:hypothetical protein